MTWLKAEYEFGSLFSYRIPDFSSQYALSSPLPGPSTIKLAIVATAIETTGHISYGEEIFNIVKNAQIKIAKPKKIAISNCLIKRLKKRKEGIGLETTFGIRGYVHLQEPLKIFIRIENDKEKIKVLLKRVRRFGTSDSLAYCITYLGNMDGTPPNDTIEPVENLREGRATFVVVPVKDINPSSKIKFKHINIYDNEANVKDVFIRRYYLIPVINKKEGKNWTLYEIS